MPQNGLGGCISELDVVAQASLVRIECPYPVTPSLNLAAGGSFMQQIMTF